MKRIKRIILCAGALTLMSVPRTTLAQSTPEPAPSESESLAKQLSNPVADLVSIPMQLNWEQGVGPNDDLRFITNFQPVVPFSLSDRWNLVGRVIVPYISQPPLVPGGPTFSGLGDILLSAFFSPAHPKGAIWGVGPALTLPTTTDPLLGSGKWSAGPTFVVLKQQGQWTYGALANHLWSYANTGDSDQRDVNQTYLQPFLAYTTKQAVTFTLSSESTANWEAESGEEWTIPVLFNVTKVTKLGPFPLSIGGGVGYFIETPDEGPEWKLRMVATIILPRKR